MAYLRDDVIALQFDALKLELSQVRSRLRALRFGDVQDEVNILCKKANELSAKLETLKAQSPLRLEY